MTSFKPEKEIIIKENVPFTLLYEKGYFEITKELLSKKFLLLDVSSFSRLKLNIVFSNNKEVIIELGTAETVERKILIDTNILK
jgi:hypothetical protein